MLGLRTTLRGFGRTPRRNISLSIRTSLSGAVPRATLSAATKAAVSTPPRVQWQPGLFQSAATARSVSRVAARRMLFQPYGLSAAHFSTATEGKQSIFAEDKNKLVIQNYLQAVVTKAADIKKTDFAKVVVTAESKKQLEVIKEVLDKLIVQIKLFNNDLKVGEITVTQHINFLRFVLSHLEAINYHLKKLLGKSVFLDNSEIALSALIENGNAIFANLKVHAAKPTLPKRNRATVLSGADNHQLEIKRFEEQQQYSVNPEFADFLNSAWKYAIDNRHRTKKIFVSYAWPEKDDDQKEEWSQQMVMQLAKDLTRMGYQVFLDKNHSGAGFLLAPFMEKIQQVDHVLVVSTRTMGAKLAKSESGVNFEHKQITDCLKQHPELIYRRFVIPVLLNNRKYCHAEFSDIAEVSICKEGYLNALESLVTHLYDAGEIEFRAWWKQTVETRLHQRVVFNSPPVDPYAVRRDDLFDGLLIKLKAFSHTARTNTTVACVGLPGTGKTHLLRQFFHDQKRKYWMAAWFNAENYDTLITSYRLFASQEHLNLLKGKELSEFKDEEIIKLVREKLAQTPESLLVYDNAESFPLIEQFMPAYGHHHVLISSRQKVWPHMVEVDRMTEEEGCELLHNITKLPKDAAMKKLVIELDRIPLALSHAAAYMAIKYISCQKYLEKYLVDKTKLLSAEVKVPSLAHDHPSVWITWQNIFNLLYKENPDAVRALRVVSLLGAEDIPNLLLEHVVDYERRQKALNKFQFFERHASSLVASLGFSCSIATTIIENPSLGAFACGIVITGIITTACRNVLARHAAALEDDCEQFISSKFDEHSKIRSALIKHAVIISKIPAQTFSMHRLVQDMMRTPFTESDARSTDILPTFTGVWMGLSVYYKMLKNNLPQVNHNKLLWNLLLHFKEANNIKLARAMYGRFETNSSVAMAIDDNLMFAQVVNHERKFRAIYEEFLNCYKQLCLDLKQDDLAASIINEVFTKKLSSTLQDAKKPEEPGNQNTPQSLRP